MSLLQKSYLALLLLSPAQTLCPAVTSIAMVNPRPHDIFFTGGISPRECNMIGGPGGNNFNNPDALFIQLSTVRIPMGETTTTASSTCRSHLALTSGLTRYEPSDTSQPADGSFVRVDDGHPSWDSGRRSSQIPHVRPGQNGHS